MHTDTFRLAEIRDGHAGWDTATDLDPADRLTARQRAIILAIRTHATAFGYPPTLRWIADTIGLSSTATVFHHITQLERLGIVVRDADRARGIRLAHRTTGGGLRLVSGDTA